MDRPIFGYGRKKYGGFWEEEFHEGYNFFEDSYTTYKQISRKKYFFNHEPSLERMAEKAYCEKLLEIQISENRKLSPEMERTFEHEIGEELRNYLSNCLDNADILTLKKIKDSLTKTR